jgi:hypothetical protein
MGEAGIFSEDERIELNAPIRPSHQDAPVCKARHPGSVDRQPEGGLLEIHQSPGPSGYAVRREATPAQRVALQALPSVEIEWSVALG